MAFHFLKTLSVVAVFLAAGFARAGSAVTYHGRILDSADKPVEAQHVLFKIQVRSPGAANCLLYEETRSVDMRGSDGIFVIPIGDGVGQRSSSDPGILLENVFSNNPALDHTSLACNTDGHYQPQTQDSRKLIVTFDDGSGTGEQALPPMDVNYVPFALSASEALKALKIGSIDASKVMSVASGAATPLSAANFSELVLLVNGNSNAYLKPSSIPTCASGEVLKGTSGAFVCVTDASGVDTLAGISCADGKILKRMAGSWACADESGVGSEVDPSVQQYAKSAPGTGLKVTSNLIVPDFGTGAGKVVEGNDSRLSDNRVASDLNSVVSTGIVQRTGAGAFSTLGVSAPIMNSGTNIGLAVGSGLTLDSGNLVPDFGTASGKVAQGNDSRFPSSTCASGNYMRWTGSAWSCEADNAADSTKVLKSGDTMTGALTLPMNGLIAGTNQLVIAGGNVGVGTASPSEKLEVNGNIKGAQLCIGTDCRSSWPSGGGGGGGLGAWSDVTASRALGTTYTNTGSSTLVAAVTFGATGTGNSVMNCLVNGVSVGYPSITAPSGSSAYRASVTFMVAPGATYRCNSGGAAGSTLYQWSEALDAGATIASGGSGTTNSIPVWTSSTNLGDSPLSVSSSNVGIGTTSPTDLLSISGSRVNGASDFTYVKLDNTGGNASHYTGLKVNNGGSESAYLIYKTPENQWQFFAGGGNPSTDIRMTVGSNGNVGIGTSNPTATLEVSGTIKATSIASSSFVPPTVQTFTSGSGTYTTPTSPRVPVYLRVRIVGGGSGGSGSGSSMVNGTSGGATTFGGVMTANGGITHVDYPAGGTASVTTGATVLKVIATQGGAGQGRTLGSTTAITMLGGQGGASFFGGGGAGNGNPASGAGAASAYGAGGGGCGYNGSSGSTGAGGGSGGYAEALIYSPSATYSYAVGAGGAGAAAGVGGCAGAAGAGGIVIVEEYYQ